jgi:hypothetical protein
MEIAYLGTTKTSKYGEEINGFEKVTLSLTIRAQQHVDAWGQVKIKIFVVSEIFKD